MRRFYDLYSATTTNLPQVVEDSAHANLPQLAENSEHKICPQVVGDFIFLVPWEHHRIIIDKYYKNRDLDAAIFYLKKTMEDGWSRNVLKTFIDSGLHLRQGKAQSSFSRPLLAPNSDLAQEITRASYIFDFTEMSEPYKEHELKKALMYNISRFLLVLGSGFTYVGQEYKLKIGHTEKFIDLLFYNIRLHAYCVIEVKTGTFDGLAGESNKISQTRTNSIIPIAQINTQYAFNQKNSISLSAQYRMSTVSKIQFG